jgi:cell wall-associated NlpC family hydrolase
MPLSFDQFFGALAQQESGGNYGAVNGLTGALGKYQILPVNVPVWSQKYLGVRWTPSQFLGDPRKQDALARAVLQDYYDKWGVRGAAAAWYSGNPALANSYKPQKGGPSIGDYVDHIIALATKNPSYDPHALQSFTYSAEDKRPKFDQPKQATTNSSQMGRVTAPGAEAVTSPGAEAVTAPGAEQVGGDTGVTSQMPSVEAQNPTQAESQVPDAPTGAPKEYMSFAGRQLALHAAQQYLGVPYVFGGGGTNGPSRSALAHGNPNQIGFDCSGFVQFALAKAGISAPRLSYDQLKMGQRVSLSALQPGDLVGFGDGHHIAIYLGNGQIIEAPHTGANVRIRKLGRGEDAWGVSLANRY